MPGQLINRTLPNLAQGISEQFEERRYEQQSEEMENLFLSLSRGILRRNGTQNNFLLSVDPTDYYMYTYSRGAQDYTYMILIGHRRWYVFNIETETMVGSWDDVNNIGNPSALDYLDTKGKHPRDVFSLVTVGDFTWLNNNQITANTSGTGDSLIQEQHKEMVLYWVKDTGNTVTSTSTSGTATIEGYEYNLTIGDYVASVKGGTNKTLVGGAKGDLLTGTEIATEIAAQLNTLGIVAPPEYRTEYISYVYNYNAWEYSYSDNAVFVYLNGTKYGPFSDPGETLTMVEINGEKIYRDVAYTSTLGTMQSSIFKQIPVYDTETGTLWQSSGPFVWARGIDPSLDFDWNDSRGNQASFGFKGVTASEDDLPAKVPLEAGTFKVKIGTTDPEDGDDYWLEWAGGIWQETKQDGLIDTIDRNTMPHTFTRNITLAGQEEFTFSFFGDYQIEDDALEQVGSSLWIDRIVGDATTSLLPSFIGKNIESIFVHNNRFGVIAHDSVVLSELSEYGNFFPTTIQDIVDTDPIDVEVATSEVTTLRRAISIEDELLIFSDNAQYTLSGLGNILTPSTATILLKSSYDYNERAQALVLNNNVYFISNYCGAGKVYEMSVGTNQNSRDTEALDISSHITNYLPNNIHTIVGTAAFNAFFMLSDNDNKSIYVCNVVGGPANRAQLAYHKWTFKNTVENIEMLRKFLVVQFRESDGSLSVARIPLELPNNISQLSYTDSYQEGCYNFPSKIKFSKWYIKDQNKNGNKRDRIQIRSIKYSITDSSFYSTYISDDRFKESTNSLTTVLPDGVWDDSGYWEDTDIWEDGPLYLTRYYANDETVTVLANNENVSIEFYNNPEEPDRGFELHTVNWEGYIFNRSRRT